MGLQINSGSDVYLKYGNPNQRVQQTSSLKATEQVNRQLGMEPATISVKMDGSDQLVNETKNNPVMNLGTGHFVSTYR